MDGETRSAAGNSSAAQAVRNQRDGLRSARVVVGTGGVVGDLLPLLFC